MRREEGKRERGEQKGKRRERGGCCEIEVREEETGTGRGGGRKFNQVEGKVYVVVIAREKEEERLKGSWWIELLAIIV